MATDNATIAGRVWLNATNDFQQRVPNPTQAGMAATSKFLFNPMNRNYFNEFMDQYINRVAVQYVRTNAWENPLAVFKGSKISYGSAIQESAIKWIKAHSYNVEDETLLKLTLPEAAVWYHTVNRKDRYDISVELPDLQMAFTEEYGLNNLVSAIMRVPYNSDNYDEYLSMMQQIAYYEENWGFYKHNLSAAPTDEATGKEFLTALRTDAGNLAFPSSLYSPVSAEYGIPTFARPNELVLFITPAVQAAIDVNTLASVFQLDKADIKYRTVLVRELPVPNAVALLTTEDFFVVNDYLYQNESFYNPQTLATNYYLHHWEIVSVSPFVPAILYTTDAATTVTKLTQSVTGVNVTAEGSASTVEPGSTLQLNVELTGTITDNDLGIEVEPDAVYWSVSAETAAGEGDPIALNSRTYVDRLNVLHVQKSGLETGNVIHVTGTTIYVNPSGTTTSYTKTLDLTVA